MKKNEVNKTLSLNNTTSHYKNIYGHIHNIELKKFINQYSIKDNEVLNRANYLNLSVKSSKYINRRYSIEIEDSFKCLFIPKDNIFYLYSVICYPSIFNSFSKFLDVLVALFGRPWLSSAFICKIDITIDLKKGIKDVINSTHILYKRYSKKYVNYNEKIESLEFGKKPFIIKIYDKRLQLRRKKKIEINEPLTRLELVLSGRKIIYKNILELSNCVKNNLDLFINPFKSIKFLDLKLEPIEKFEKKKDIKKYTLLTTLLDTSTYFHMHKRLSKGGHFKRDYGKFISVQPSKEQPIDIIKKDLEKYFKIKEGEKNG